MKIFKYTSDSYMHKSRFTFITFEEFLKRQEQKEQKEQKETHKFITFEEFLTQQEQTPSMREFLKKYTVKIYH